MHDDDAQVEALLARAQHHLSQGHAAVARGDHASALRAYDNAFDAFEGHDTLGVATASLGFGGCALQLGEFAEAESALELSIATFSGLRRDDDVARARIVLGRLYFATAPPGWAAEQLRLARNFFSVERDVLGRLTWARATSELADVEVAQDKLDDALAHFRAALKVFVDLDAVDDEYETRIALAGLVDDIRRAAGEPPLGGAIDDVDPESELHAARRHFESSGRIDQVADVDFRLATIYARRHDFHRADDAFARATAGLVRTRQFHQLANLQWNRVERYLAEREMLAGADALVGETIDTAVSALIAADYERFQFVDPRRRVEWAERLRTRTASTFAIADELGDATLVADLIEWAINGGVHTDDEPRTVGPDFEAFDKRHVVRRSVDAQRSTPPSATAYLLGASNLLDTEELPLAPPPTLLGENGRVILGRQRGLAAAMDPELRDVIATSPTVAAW